MKKLFTFICSVIFLMTFTTIVSASGVVERLNELRTVYPAGKYWNHYVSTESEAGNALQSKGDSKTFADSISDYPCAHHGGGWSNSKYVGSYDCNYYHGFQCNGFARRVFYKVFGQDIGSASANRTDFENIKPGDFVHMTSSDPNGHYAIVLSKNGDTITIAEANHLKNCQIWWDREINISRLKYFKRASNYDEVDSRSTQNSSFISSQDGYLYKSADNDTSGEYPGKWINETASTGGKVVGGIPYGEYAVVTKYSSDNKFGFVNYKGAEGWVYIYEKLFPYQGPYTCPVVTFNANGGSVSTGSKKVYINTPYGTLPTPTRSGYIFDGWYTSANGGTRITSSTNVTLTANQTLYAHWSIEECSHSYKTYTESTHPHEKYKKCTKCGEIVDLGTVYDDDCEKCNPSPEIYTVTYNANGGIEPPSPQTVTAGESVIISREVLSRNGYEFLGWSAKKNPSEDDMIFVGGDNLAVVGDVVLYAVWEKIDYESVTIILTIDSKKATVSGKTIYNDVAPIIRNDRTMLPARFVAENLGASVSWDDVNQKVIIKGADGTRIEIYVNSTTAYVNGVKKALDSPAFIEDSRTYTPVRFICDNLGASVKWDEINRRVTITK